MFRPSGPARTLGFHFDYQEKYWLFCTRKIIFYLCRMKPVGLSAKRLSIVFPDFFSSFFQFCC